MDIREDHTHLVIVKSGEEWIVRKPSRSQEEAESGKRDFFRVGVQCMVVEIKSRAEFDYDRR